MTTTELRRQIDTGAFDGAFSALYADVPAARARYLNAVSAFERLWGEREAILVSAPGRTELGGNHTDHQRGSVLAAAVDIDIICVVSPKAEKNLHICSEGHRPDIIGLDDLTPRKDERGHGGALARGVAEWFYKNGCSVGGLDAYTTSDVLAGSGLSSSAAFEVAVGSMLNLLYNGGAVTPEEIALAGRYAENEHFGKPSGLMDQMASSVGGFVHIDFKSPEKAIVTPVSFDFAATGFSLCVIDTKGTHADLTEDYAAIPREMRAVAGYFGKQYLREVDADGFYAALPAVRAAAGDRAALRAMHFFQDSANVEKQAAALSDGDFAEYLRLVNASGGSSFTCLQNISAGPNGQELALALAVSARLLSERGGAWRVHGGGFAGTIQAYVPNAFLDEYRAEMDRIFGGGACRALSIRQAGGIQVSV